MKFKGSRKIETERLLLMPQTIKEQKRLWEILMIDDVKKYYLTVPIKFKNKLIDWNLQEKYYKTKIEHANDKDVFCWSIFLKDTDKCVGQIDCHMNVDNQSSIDVYDVGWYIDPLYQGMGYCTEAARAMLYYMFAECDIKKIITSAAVCNSSSWMVMEKLGFIREKKTRKVQYTFLDELTEVYIYTIDKEKFLSFNF